MSSSSHPRPLAPALHARQRALEGICRLAGLATAGDEAFSIASRLESVADAATLECLERSAEILEIMADEEDVLAITGPEADVVVHREREKSFKKAASKFRGFAERYGQAAVIPIATASLDAKVADVDHSWAPNSLRQNAIEIDVYYFGEKRPFARLACDGYDWKDGILVVYKSTFRDGQKDYDEVARFTEVSTFSCSRDVDDRPQP